RYNSYRHLGSSLREGCINQVPGDLIERDVVASCGQLLASSAALKTAIESALKDATGELKDAKVELSDAEREIRQLDGEHTRTLDLLTKFDHSEPAKNKLIQKATRISERLEGLRGTCEALCVKLGKSSDEQSPTKVAAQMRRLFGLQGLAVLNLPNE